MTHFDDILIIELPTAHHMFPFCCCSFVPFSSLLQWRDDVNSKVMLANNEPIPTLLLANKCDLPGVTVDKEFLDKFCQENGFIGWFATSAQKNSNIGI
jgi:Ras-related protein Rab-32